MRIVSADLARARLARAAGALLLSAVWLTACAADDEPVPAPKGDAEQATVPALKKVLRLRARNLLAANLSGFLDTIDQSSEDFVARERVYFNNLTRLPLSKLRFQIDEDTIVGEGDGVTAVVNVRMQLKEYDVVPVTRPARFKFVPGGTGYLVALDRDREWEERTGADVQPWDSGAITVASGNGVLGIFDATSASVSEQVIAEVESGIAQVSQLVPYRWRGNVVVYALSDTEMLSGLDDLPGDNPNAIDAVAFPVPSEPEGGEIASTRFLLHPRMLKSDPVQLARLIRHELTHVALGTRDDSVPTWLGEGIAEWVSVQPLAPPDRLISQEAIDAAEEGPSELASDVDFNGPDQAANYGLAWWACQSIVDLYGEQMLWRLLDELAETSPPDQDDRLQQILQLGEGQLAREAARRILATYA